MADAIILDSARLNRFFKTMFCISHWSLEFCLAITKLCMDAEAMKSLLHQILHRVLEGYLTFPKNTRTLNHAFFDVKGVLPVVGEHFSCKIF